MCYYICIPSRHGGIGRHKGLKIPRRKTRTGSIPVAGTTKGTPRWGCPFCGLGGGIEPIQIRMSGGHPLPPVQTLVATIIFAAQKCKSIPVACTPKGYPVVGFQQRNRTHSNTDVRWTSAATSANTGGYYHFCAAKMQIDDRCRWQQFFSKNSATFSLF